METENLVTNGAQSTSCADPADLGSSEAKKFPMSTTEEDLQQGNASVNGVTSGPVEMAVLTEADQTTQAASIGGNGVAAGNQAATGDMLWSPGGLDFWFLFCECWIWIGAGRLLQGP